MKFAPRSLAVRVVAFSTVWALIALVAIYTVIATLYRETSEKSFESLLSAHLFNLIGSVGVTPSGTLTGAPDLGDLRFSEPNSGWYWSVEPMSQGLSGQLRSLSMTKPIAAASVESVPFTGNFQRKYTSAGIRGETVEVLESEVVLDAQNRVARFRVMGNLTEFNAGIADFDRQLLIYLSLFGAGMIAINAIAILFGLRPLGQVSAALAKVREGTAQQLDGRFPTEIEPLAMETNALIENNRRIVERARTQVGNLAHSLKTPLAVLVNEARTLGGAPGKLIGDQADAMQDQLQHYLQRARIAAQRDSVVYRTPVRPVLERLVRVMEKLNPEVTFTLDCDPKLIFGGEREDLEEIVGNLLDNAAKWANRKVGVTVLPQPATDRQSLFVLTIEDDGPGIPEERAADVLKRGRRLDETKPGTGLGLSIVADLASEYGGDVRLVRSAQGGLGAIVRLPGVG